MFSCYSPFILLGRFLFKNEVNKQREALKASIEWENCCQMPLEGIRCMEAGDSRGEMDDSACARRKEKETDRLSCSLS